MPRAALALTLLLAVPTALAFESRDIFYFYGYVKHFEPTPRTNEGNMKYLGYAREFPYGKWRFTSGGATYVDSYRVRSYSVFSDVSHDDVAFGILRPALSLQCQSKGRNYTSQDRQFICFPLPKVRIGADDGFLMNVSGAPKLGKLTDGFVVAEFGFKW